MAKKIIALNWKMSSSKKHIDDFFNILDLEEIKNNINSKLIIFPSSIYIDYVNKKLIENGVESYISVGVQDISTEEKGAYTGEISALMAKDFDCEYTLVGHSERRQNHQEGNLDTKQKINIANLNNIVPILCVGESISEREDGTYKDIILSQVESINKNSNEVIIAYEPVWSIGTGKIPSIYDISEIVDLIKGKIPNASVLYGGSVNSSNSNDILSINSINGLLVGSAGLKPSEVNVFIKNTVTKL
jgi:triosephosphate isomerase